MLKTKQSISSKVMASLKNDLSSLVGREITIISDSFDNSSLKTKVVLVNGSNLSIDRGGHDVLVNKLNSGERVIVQFNYRKQRVAGYAHLSLSAMGRCSLVLDDHIEPLNRRMFKRFWKPYRVNCAILPQVNVTAEKISKLRWLKTESLNFSSGGLLLEVPSNLTEQTYLLLNIETDGLTFPELLVGQVRYSIPTDSYAYNAGIMFIVNELKEKHFSSLVLKKLPSPAFLYTKKQRLELDKYLTKTIPERQES